jgi:4-hydroxyphenylpyruvate dioxygenase-like putative hemolysin
VRCWGWSWPRGKAEWIKTGVRDMFKKIDHVEIVTDQPDKTVEFYTQVLEFKIKVQDRIERSSVGVPMNPCVLRPERHGGRTHFV